MSADRSDRRLGTSGTAETSRQMLSRRNCGTGLSYRLWRHDPLRFQSKPGSSGAQHKSLGDLPHAAIGPQVGTDLVLFEGAYVRGNVRDFRAGQLHVRHLRVWIEEKEGNLCRVKVGALRYAGKWRRLRRRFLTWCNHMAFGAPALDHGFSMVWISSKC